MRWHLALTPSSPCGTKETTNPGHSTYTCHLFDAARLSPASYTCHRFDAARVSSAAYTCHRFDAARLFSAAVLHVEPDAATAVSISPDAPADAGGHAVCPRLFSLTWLSPSPSLTTHQQCRHVGRLLPSPLQRRRRPCLLFSRPRDAPCSDDAPCFIPIETPNEGTGGAIK